MHARYLAALALTIGPLSLLIPACVVPADDVESGEQVAEVQEHDDEFRFYQCTGGPIACMAECNGEGVYCGPGAFHPKKGGVGLGILFGCVTSGKRACAFSYTNGDKCFFPQDGSTPICRYS